MSPDNRGEIEPFKDAPILLIRILAIGWEGALQPVGGLGSIGFVSILWTKRVDQT